MGCGCNKKRNVVAATSSERGTATLAPTVARKSASTMYDVFNGEGALVASYSNPVTARAEARRSGGNVVPRGSSTAAATKTP